jgi:hypothetical protein
LKGGKPKKKETNNRKRKEYNKNKLITQNTGKKCETLIASPKAII